MFRSRSIFALTIFALTIGGLAVAGLLAAWLATGWGDARARAAAIEARPARVAKDKATELASELGAAFDAIRSAENARPYYEYQNLFTILAEPRLGSR